MKIIVVIFILFLVAAGYFAYQKTGSSKITEEQAVEIVKKLPEVQDYLKRVPNGRVEVDNELEGQYNVHVYEIKDGHTATFNWYQIDKTKGKAEKEF